MRDQSRGKITGSSRLTVALDIQSGPVSIREEGCGRPLLQVAWRPVTRFQDEEELKQICSVNETAVIWYPELCLPLISASFRRRAHTI